MASKIIKKLTTNKSKSKPKSDKVSNLIRININIPKSLHAKIKKFALNQEVTMSKAISGLIKEYLNNQAAMINKNSE
ncbi:MAG: hypothetical protein ACR2HS_05200 [Gammaproteobacteria bacterium]